jgi:hypothetical protein
MAKSKGVSKSKPKEKKKKKKRGAVAQVVRIHSLNGNPPLDGVQVAQNAPQNVLTVVGFVKPAGATVDCQLYSQNGTILAQPRQVVATQNRWTVTFTQNPDGVLGGGTQFMFEANLDQTAVSAFVTFTLQ